MGTYKYRAKKGFNEVVEGLIDAQSEKEAIEKLSSMELLPLHLEEARASKSKSISLVKFRGKIKSREITIFSRQLASLLKSGVAILNALNIINDQSDDSNLKNILYNISNAIKDGATFSSVLAQYPRVFSPLYVAMIRTGEGSGSLPDVLLRISDYRIKQEEMLSRFRMALVYPILMAVVGLGTIIFMLTFVMPRLMKIFLSMGQDLPLPTRILIAISGFLCHSWFWVVLILAIIILILRRELRTKSGRLSLSLFKLHLPLFGKLILKAELARFCRTLELLIKDGITILKAIEIAVPVIDNEIIKNHLLQSYQQLQRGGSFGRSLRNVKLFPVFMSNLIGVGEESGRLDEALAEVAGNYERDTDEAIKVMNSLLEPVMILVMGLIVGFIVVAMILPIFEINMMAK
jgi:type II secretory pathway component PulF